MQGNSIIASLIILALGTLGALAQSAPATERDSIAMPQPDTVKVDTLKNVTILRHIPINLKPYEFDIMPSSKGISDILGQDLNDKIMHPFAFKQRRKERHRRKMAKILEEYDKVKTPNELLREALISEGINPDTLPGAPIKEVEEKK